MTQTNPGNQPFPSKGRKITLYLIFGAICTVACLSLWHEWTAPYVSPARIRDSVEKVLRDTLQINHRREMSDSL